MSVAKLTSQLSVATRAKVGAIVVKDHQILATGYNGTPSGWSNTAEVDGVTVPELVHAEENCITKLAKSTESAEGASLFVTLSPCLPCAKLIHGSGIKEVYYLEEYRDIYPIEFLQQLNVKVQKLESPSN